ncbi:hypothetical protein PCANC_18782 [Puccinia coronata f. sp. avenae]|uniref:Uncharacterized protein n=1 Tax=Puccinia coronata f. sp. avenae TaxID=200324 RepID=A0A2N5SD42_9BASI|nr:hypothetical protein PCANC_18782 [Puccinia coronata f. sp. avenae]
MELSEVPSNEYQRVLLSQLCYLASDWAIRGALRETVRSESAGHASGYAVEPRVTTAPRRRGGVTGDNGTAARRFCRRGPNTVPGAQFGRRARPAVYIILHKMLTLAVFLGAALTFSTCTLAAPTGYNYGVYNSNQVYSNSNLNTPTLSSSSAYNANNVYNANNRYDPVAGVNTNNVYSAHDLVNANNLQTSSGISSNNLYKANGVYNSNSIYSPYTGASSQNVQASNQLYNANNYNNARAGISSNNVYGANNGYGYQSGSTGWRLY